MEQILKDVLPVIVTAVVGILVAIINALKNAGVKYIETKIEATALKMGVDKYNQELAFAKSIYHIVEENFRINEVIGDKIAQKQEMFDKLLKEKIPYITDEDIIHLRQAVCGSVNSIKDVVVAPQEQK